MTLQARADAYASAFPQFPASHLRVVQEQGGDCLYGTWLIGNDYRNRSKFYGAYPLSYLPRVRALFPDVVPMNASRGKYSILHVFSGSLPAGDYVRCDVKQPAEISSSVYDLDPARDGRYPLVLADPPYSSEDAELYGTPMVDRGRALRALARVTELGGHLVWLDTVWPMHRKAEWRTAGRITLVRSTNHRVRLISIFERSAS